MIHADRQINMAPIFAVAGCAFATAAVRAATVFSCTYRELAVITVLYNFYIKRKTLFF